MNRHVFMASIVIGALSLAATGTFAVPAAYVEPGIAASIVYIGLENLARPPIRRRAFITFALGLVPGAKGDEAHHHGVLRVLRKLPQTRGIGRRTGRRHDGVGGDTRQGETIALHIAGEVAMADRSSLQVDRHATHPM